MMALAVHFRRALLVVSLAMLSTTWVAPTGAESTETTPWDQKAVTDLAKELAESVSGIEDALRNEPGNTMPTGDRRARYAVKQDLRRLRREAQHLARELESGLGQEETLNVFLKLQEIAHYAGENGRRAALTKPTLDHVDQARAQLTKLAPYYGEIWTPVMTPR